ncbi:hypothetical protein KY290_031269 [Solanum tuberosum]|uniref:MULE transposase domain-containing protein n=1 Tax=Solanum tuberosum TaxID=4113 RepID=A0ABQ7U8M4_SOLTU|nr:hypothetical protein KY290_031269 [Solanum tuberosum]
MTLTIVTLQFHYGGCFVSDPTLRYVNGITSVEKINIDVDELHIMLFHKIALELGVENVETFGCRVNKKGMFYMLNIDSDVLYFLNGLKGVDSVDVYVVHPISIPLVVEEILVLPSTNANVSSSPQQDSADVYSSPHKNREDLSSSPQIDRVDVSSSQPFDENENRDLNQNQSPLVEEQAPSPRFEEHSDSDSLYDVDENIDDLNGNNQMYPIAWTVIDKETKETWSWFLKRIKHDLELTESEGLTVMSNMQKGLHLALIDVLPNAEIRWCASHIWAN